jgi:membrane protein required for beta-lactamase induction
VRLLALSYALVGHFTTAFSYLRKNFSNGFQRSMHFAIDVGFAALNLEHPDVIHADKEENEAALLLVDRALLLWIVILAIFTLGGWLR